jgi:Flp pilus assembly protein TadG
MCSGKNFKRSLRRGAAIVEFAVIAPIFLTLVGGMIELGRAIVVVQILTNASREGSRIAGYDTTTSSSTVTSAVNTFLTNEGINGATTAVTPSSLSSVADGTQVSVTVSIPYSSVSWLPKPFFLGGKTLTATTVMCREPAP